MRIAVLDRDKCVKGKRCSYECIKYCPGVRMGEQTITKDDEGYPILDETLCTGCNICAKKCPFTAIVIVNLPEELEDPIHQYGRNGFRVYSLPTPKAGVVGIIGSNGIGKTTVLNILGGLLQPNLGKDSATWDEVLARFRGQEIQSHLEAVKVKGVRIAFKPQAVDKLPRAFSGTVKELLAKTRERTVDLSPLNIKPIENKKLSEISGGELQRVAIAAALQKDADLYCFDEPTSYLDVRQRLNMARVIRSLAETKKVMLIEHDLAVLDYLSDHIHVMYGKEGAYGVVSSLKGVRNGINEYLDGFLKSENMRFRPYEIKFPVKPPADSWKGKEKLSYPAFTKTYPGFYLEVEQGSLRKGEVVGVLGANATGKSTFMKILAGVETSDQGKQELPFKISYKPQYITSDFDGSVAELVNRSGIKPEIYDTYIKKELATLYDKPVQGLSGGELQRVGIALALSRECDVCLLDEPSAFLDVEQRILFADIIRRVTSKVGFTTIVIDHDITIQDYVSDRLMVFDGVPGESGRACAPVTMRAGMNAFLSGQGVTYRRDPDSGRPRANKPGSQKDEEQRKSGEYYYET
jgi:ATP-binding cassette subfamily E protein 1